MEHQGKISSLKLSQSLQLPLSVIEDQLQALDRKYPKLLLLNYNYDSSLSFMMVKIAGGGDDIARKLLGGIQ
jgi:hypothetical protein